MTRDPHKRAKNSDRDACVEVIEAAYVDGQIGDADRELRVGQALSATTLGELDQLVRDLQAPAAPPAPQQPPAYQPPAYAPPGPAAPAPAARPRRSGRGFPVALLVLAFVVVLVGVGATFLVSLTRGVGEIDFGSTGEQVDDPYELSSAGIEAFLGRYEAEFGGTTAVRAVFYGEYVVVDVPTPDGKNRVTGWQYRDGRFSEFGGTRANAGGGQAVDLRQVDLARLERNIAEAKRSLNVESPDTVYVIVDHATYDAGPTVRIYVSNEFNESGYVATDLSGRKETFRYPFGG